jgi:serine protease inhibitor
VGSTAREALQDGLAKWEFPPLLLRRGLQSILVSQDVTRSRVILWLTEMRMKFLLSLLMLCFVLLPPAHGEQTPPAADRAAVVEGDNAFAVALYGQLRNQSGNLFFSPESISTALAMAYAGARGGTASEMATTLHFTLPPRQLHPAMGVLLHDLNATHEGYQLSIANALWAQRGYNFLSEFLQLLNNDYGAGLNQVDFKGSTEAARLTINQWVEQKTANKIKDLLPPGALKPSTRLVLTNAIYFKGNWLTQFDKAQTKDEDFHLSPAQAKRAPLMHREGSFNYFNGGTFQILEIPYQSNELSMIVFLPNDPSGLAALEQSLTPSNTQQWLRQLGPVSKVIVTMPKFKTTQQFELGGTLAAMGMPQAFSAGADFSGMTGNRDFFISAVIHKAYIDVNEEGTEAAAATAVTMRAMAARMPPPAPVFRADHPFVFLIRDIRSNSILFMGRLADPTS